MDRRLKNNPWLDAQRQADLEGLELGSPTSGCARLAQLPAGSGRLLAARQRAT
jgi:hypothetical protein